MNFKKTGLIIIVLLLLSVSVYAEEEIAAIVDSEEITVNQVDQYAGTQQMIMQLFQFNQQFGQVLISTDAGKELLDEYRKVKVNELIIQKLLENEAKKQEITLTQERKDEIFNEQMKFVERQNNITEEQFIKVLEQQGIDSLESYKEMFFANNEGIILIGELQKKEFASVLLNDSDVKDYYDNNQDLYKHDLQIKASHILVDTEEKADEVLNKLKNGADFAKLAKEYSICPSAEDGGDLGYFGKGKMVKEFEEVAFDLQKEQISKKVKTQFGYHIIKVMDRKEAGITPFEDVKEDIRNNLLNQKRQETWTELVKALHDKAEIEIKL